MAEFRPRHLHPCAPEKHGEGLAQADLAVRALRASLELLGSINPIAVAFHNADMQKASAPGTPSNRLSSCEMAGRHTDKAAQRMWNPSVALQPDRCFR
jgi:hypothetical protein